MMEYSLDYAARPVGEAVMALRGDLCKAYENNDYRAIKLIRVHWKLAERRFITEANTDKARKLFTKSQRAMFGKNAPHNPQEVSVTWLRLAARSFQETADLFTDKFSA